MTETCGAAFAATNRKIRRGELMAEARSMTSVPVAESSMATKTHRQQGPATTEPSGLQQARNGKNPAPSQRGGTSVNNFTTFRPSSNDSLPQRGGVEGANFAQKTFGSMFSKGGAFAGQSVDGVAAALRSGAIKPSGVPIITGDRPRF